MTHWPGRVRNAVRSTFAAVQAEVRLFSRFTDEGTGWSHRGYLEPSPIRDPGMPRP